MTQPFLFPAIHPISAWVFAPLYGGVLLYLLFVLSKNRERFGLKKLVAIQASLIGVLLTTPGLSPMMIKLAVFTAPFLFVLFQRMEVVRDGMRPFMVFIAFLWGITFFIDLLFFLFQVNSSLYPALLTSWAVLLHCFLIMYCCYVCYIQYGLVTPGISPTRFRDILSIMLIEMISAGALMLSIFGEKWVFFFVFSFAVLVALQVVLVYREYTLVFKKREYSVCEGDKNEPDHLLKDDACSEETAILLRLIQLFEKEKLYLSPDITVAEVAAKIYTNRTYLSRALNKRTHKNFSQFVNYYRIKEVCRLFIATPDIRMQQLSEQCGFNTCSSFASAFRLNTGYTPVEWGKEVRRKQVNHGWVTLEDYIL